MSAPDQRLPNRGVLLRLTAAKAVASTAIRWVPPFLPTLERAFGVSTSQLTTVLGLSEIAGMSTVAAGPHLDRGRERLIMVCALATISVSSLVAVGGSLATFAIGFVGLIVGAANFTVASHAWISHRVDYRWRARTIGTFETAWALALLIGGPVTALLINWIGWRGPFLFIALASALAALVTAVGVPRTSQIEAADAEQELSKPKERIPAHAWLVVAGSALLGTAGLSIFAISGSWLDQSFGVSTAGLGLIVMVLGAFELIASGSSAAFADRIGKMRSTLISLTILGAGLVVMVSAGERLGVGVVGFLVFLLGFEYGIVTSFSLISEAMPNARGRLLAIGQASGTVTRGCGVILGGWLFDRHGIAGSALMSGIAAALSFICLTFSRTRSNA